VSVKAASRHNLLMYCSKLTPFGDNAHRNTLTRAHTSRTLFIMQI